MQKYFEEYEGWELDEALYFFLEVFLAILSSSCCSSTIRMNFGSRVST